LSSLEENKISRQLLDAFSREIVDPYFNGDIGKAFVTLMDKALIEEELLQKNLAKRRHRPQ
jgi:hypothetical protein